MSRRFTSSSQYLYFHHVSTDAPALSPCQYSLWLSPSPAFYLSESECGPANASITVGAVSSIALTPYGVYGVNLNCELVVYSGSHDAAVRFELSSFYTEANVDVLYVIDGATSADPVIAAVSGVLGTQPRLYVDGCSVWFAGVRR